MKNNNPPTNPEEINFFKQVDLPFEKSKDEVWDLLAKKIQTPPHKIEKVISMAWYKVAAAAILFLFLGAGIFARFYTTTIATNNAEQLTHQLPDGSSIQLNAASSISYPPYWWAINRVVNFEGEAFFKVAKGSNFTVHSSKGTTQVLGTSFNISTRNNRYQVFCVTGKVRVSNNTTQEAVLLNPNMYAAINEQAAIAINPTKPAEESLAWTKHQFNFVAQPLTEVLKEIERQYDINIDLAVKDAHSLLYTAYFDKPTNPSQTLNLVCQSFNFKLVEQNISTFRIVQK